MNSLIKFSKTKVFLCICVVFVIAITFKVIFGSSSLSLGDAPYFSNESISWFLTEPQAWTQRGNAFGGLNQFIWNWPLTFIISVFQKFAGATNWLLIRIFFYLPAIFLSTSGAFFLSRFFKYKTKVGVIAAAVCVLNTYFLLLFDGGQVGVLLAFGIFPWSLTFLIRYFEGQISLKSFLLSLTTLFVLTVADPRVAIICIATAFAFEIRKIKKLILILVFWILINLYWLYPLATLSSGSSSTGIGNQFTSLLNGMFLYAPHWHENLYGVVTYPGVLFFIFPALFFISTFPKFKRQKVLLILFLIFVFAIKGTTAPLGNIYSFFVNLPFGNAFRDSTKFFIPLIFVSGLLVGQALIYLEEKLKNKYVSLSFLLLLIAIVFPAISGKMNFVLSGRESLASAENINKFLNSTEGLGRNLWFPETDPRALDTPTNQAVSAKSLADFRPFASLNVGSGDLFNFLNNQQSEWWLSMFGIKNLIFSGDPRTITLDNSQQEDWDRLNNLLPSLNYLKSVEAPVPVYANANSLPNVFGVDKLFVVVGSDDIYTSLQKLDTKFKPYDYAFLFTDDGKWDPSELLQYATTSAVVIMNKESKTDLAMSLAQQSFANSMQASKNQFATFDSNQYLKYKYELLIRENSFADFDFNQGISFSTETGETMVFPIEVNSNDNYILSVRSASTQSPLEISVDGRKIGESEVSDHLQWKSSEIYLNKGSHEVSILNTGGLQIFNVLNVVTQSDFDKASTQAASITSHFKSIDLSEFSKDFLDSKWNVIEYEISGAGKYKLNPDPDTKWIVYTDAFNKDWRIRKDTLIFSSLPLYSAVNGFYRRPEWDEMTLEFVGQESVRWGIYYSVLSVLGIAIFILWKLSKE